MLFDRRNFDQQYGRILAGGNVELFGVSDSDSVAFFERITFSVYGAVYDKKIYAEAVRIVKPVMYLLTFVEFGDREPCPLIDSQAFFILFGVVGRIGINDGADLVRYDQFLYRRVDVARFDVFHGRDYPDLQEFGGFILR